MVKDSLDYTKGLLQSLPRPEVERVERLETIPGIIPSLFELPKGCKFCTRCSVFEERKKEGDTEFTRRCEEVEPPLREIAPERHVRCHLVEESGGAA